VKPTIFLIIQLEKKTGVKDSLFRVKASFNLSDDLCTIFKDGDVSVVIEIPSGTSEKWELDKSDNKIKLEVIDSFPRIINYLSYPCNYGMIPKYI